METKLINFWKKLTLRIPHDDNVMHTMTVNKIDGEDLLMLYVYYEGSFYPFLLEEGDIENDSVTIANIKEKVEQKHEEKKK